MTSSRLEDYVTASRVMAPIVRYDARLANLKIVEWSVKEVERSLPCGQGSALQVVVRAAKRRRILLVIQTKMTISALSNAGMLHVAWLAETIVSSRMLADRPSIVDHQ
jgi:hypothetical protein